MDAQNAALVEEVQRLADENARLLHEKLQRQRDELLMENVRLQGLTAAAAVSVPPGLENAPPGLDGPSAPPGQWDPVTAANVAMLSMVSGNSQFKMGGMTCASTISDLNSLPSSVACSFVSSYGCGSSMQSSAVEGFGVSEPCQAQTTLIFRNLPRCYNRDMIVQMLEKQGFDGHFDFVYLPIDFGTGKGFGYAFVNMVDEDVAERCIGQLQGFKEWTLHSDIAMDVTYCESHQGLHARIERYRNSPIMHESVADELKPAIFEDGKRVPFPPPTKKISAPKLKLSGASHVPLSARG